MNSDNLQCPLSNNNLLVVLGNHSLFDKFLHDDDLLVNLGNDLGSLDNLFDMKGSSVHGNLESQFDLNNMNVFDDMSDLSDVDCDLSVVNSS